jgi:hypothetical protein
VAALDTGRENIAVSCDPSLPTGNRRVHFTSAGLVPNRRNRQ